MSRFLSTLRKMQETGKWTPTLLTEVPKQALGEPDFTDLDGQAPALMLDEPLLPDNRYQAGRRAQIRREQGHTEKPRAIEGYTQIDERVMASSEFAPGAAEQYRKLYIEIVQARRIRALQTLLITSALGGEGKSLSALNLAITCATTGDQHGVLLIDTDLRRPGIHKYLSIHPQVWFSRLLAGRRRILPNLF